MSWSLPVSINPKPLSVSRLMVPSGIFQSPQKVSSSVQKNAVVTLGLGSDLTRASRRRRPAAHDPSCDARTGLSYGPSRLRSRHKLSRNSRRFDAHIAVPVPDRGGGWRSSTAPLRPASPRPRAASGKPSRRSCRSRGRCCRRRHAAPPAGELVLRKVAIRHHYFQQLAGTRDGSAMRREERRINRSCPSTCSRYP